VVEDYWNFKRACMCSYSDHHTAAASKTSMLCGIHYTTNIRTLTC